MLVMLFASGAAVTTTPLTAAVVAQLMLLHKIDRIDRRSRR